MVGGLRGEVWPHSAWRASRIAEVDAELVRLGRGAGGLRLRLGEVLEALGSKGGVEALGFSSMGAYVVERCGLGARWVSDTRTLARRLHELPRLRRALASGQVTWCMANEVARAATAESEAFLLALAKRTTVRRMKKLLTAANIPASQGRARGEGACEAAAKRGPAQGGDACPLPERREGIKRTSDREVALLFEHMRELAERVVGSGDSDTILEAMLAEGMTALGANMGEVPEPYVRKCREPRDEPAPQLWVPPALPVIDGDLPEDARGLDAEAVGLARELARRDLALGELTREPVRGAPHRVASREGRRRLNAAPIGMHIADGMTALGAHIGEVPEPYVRKGEHGRERRFRGAGRGGWGRTGVWRGPELSGAQRSADSGRLPKGSAARPAPGRRPPWPTM
jgi:hypothetical protein